MKEQENYDFDRIARAIKYIQKNFKQQPSLDDVAGEIAMSTSHFQRVFTQWAGVSPKKFLQFTTIEYAKEILTNTHASLLDTAQMTGLSGSGRLYDLFVNIEGMTPGEYKNGGENLSINYSFSDTPFGEVLIASTNKGVCRMEFVEDRNITLGLLYEQFPNAHFSCNKDAIQQRALIALTDGDVIQSERIRLHLKGSEFQLKVWNALLQIPLGGLASYSDIASKIQRPTASRAVGTAIGDNPVAFIIPCHRVIRSNGQLGNYHWGEERKASMIGWEAVRKDKLIHDQ